MQPAPAAQAPIDLLPYGRVTDEELQRLRRARDEFLSQRGTDTELRTVIRRSWKRCSQWGVQPDLRVLEVRTEPRLDATVQRVSHAILHHLAQRIYRTRAAVLLTDDRGVIADWSGDGEVRQLLEQVQAVPGAALSEEITGTNAIGTALEEGIGVQICSGEHFIEAFQVFACTAIPIRHPLTNRVLAVLDLTTRAQEISPAVARLVARAARAIQERLHEELTAQERSLLYHYLREPLRHRHAVIAFNGHTTISSTAALRLLDQADYATLLPLMEEGLHATRPFEREVLLTSGQQARLRISPRFDGGTPVGIILHVEPLSAPQPPPSAWPVVDPFAHLIGQSVAFRRALETARAAANSGLPVLVVGEPGTGKQALAEAMAGAIGGQAATVECAGLHGERDLAAWSARVRAALDQAMVVIFRHLDALPTAAQQVLLDLLAQTGPHGQPRRIATAASATKLPREIVDRVTAVQISLPPLRERREDIPALVRHILGKLQTDRRLRVSCAALDALCAADWPGNIRQLENVLRSAALSIRGWEITLADLPDDLARQPRRAPLARLEQVEVTEIRRALREASGNRAKAAATLGISRSTLYRKLEMYRRLGMDLES